MKKLRAGVVGLGRRGQELYRWLVENIPEVEGAAACDLKPDLWYSKGNCATDQNCPLAEVFPQVRFYENYDEMLAKANLDFVLVETPASCHTDFCIRALQHGVNVYSDIPLVRSLSEAAELWTAQQKSSAMLMTGATTCGWGFVLSLQDLVRKGLLGKPFAMEAEYIHDCRYLWELTPWRKPSSPWNSMPIRYCTHSLGPMLSIIKEDLRTVSCISTGSHVTDNPFAHDYMCALFQTESGVSLRFTASFINNDKNGLHSFRVFGTRGNFEHLASRGSQPEKTLFSSEELVGAENVTELPVCFSPYIGKNARDFKIQSLTGHGGADSYLLQLFVRAILSGARKSPISVREGLRMTLPGIYAAECVIRNEGKITIHYPWEEKEFAEDIRKYEGAGE